MDQTTKNLIKQLMDELGADEISFNIKCTRQSLETNFPESELTPSVMKEEDFFAPAETTDEPEVSDNDDEQINTEQKLKCIVSPYRFFIDPDYADEPLVVPSDLTHDFYMRTSHPCYKIVDALLCVNDLFRVIGETRYLRIRRVIHHIKSGKLCLGRNVEKTIAETLHDMYITAVTRLNSFEEIPDDVAVVEDVPKPAPSVIKYARVNELPAGYHPVQEVARVMGCCFQTITRTCKPSDIVYYKDVKAGAKRPCMYVNVANLIRDRYNREKSDLTYRGQDCTRKELDLHSVCQYYHIAYPSVQ